MLAGTVTAGDYNGASLALHFKTGLAIMQGLFKKNWIPIKKETVKNYELIQADEQTSAVSAVARGVIGSALFGSAGVAAALSAKKKGWFTVAVEFNDGKRSLIEMDSDFFKVVQRTLF